MSDLILKVEPVPSTRAPQGRVFMKKVGVVIAVIGLYLLLRSLSARYWNFESLIWYGLFTDSSLFLTVLSGWLALWLGVALSLSERKGVVITGIFMAFMLPTFLILLGVFLPYKEDLWSDPWAYFGLLFFCVLVPAVVGHNVPVSRKRKREIVLVLGIVLLLLNGVFWFRNFTLKEPNLPEDVPQLSKLPIANLSPLSNGTIEYQSQPVNALVRFKDAIFSLQRKWYGRNAYFQIEGEEEIMGKPTITERSWGSSISVPRWYIGERVSPEFTVSFLLTEKDIHRTIKVYAIMNVTYPWGYGGFLDNSRHEVATEFELFVVSPEEMQLVREHNAYVNMHAANPWMFGLISFALWGFYALIEYFSPATDKPKPKPMPMQFSNSFEARHQLHICVTIDVFKLTRPYILSI